MTNASKLAMKIFYYSKYLAITLILIGIPAIVVDSTSESEIPLLVGLFTLLVTSDKIEDERSVQIKTTSLYYAFIIAYAIKLISSNLYGHGLISVELSEINYFLILVLALGNIIYYSRMYILKY